MRDFTYMIGILDDASLFPAPFVPVPFPSEHRRAAPGVPSPSDFPAGPGVSFRDGSGNASGLTGADAVLARESGEIFIPVSVFSAETGSFEAITRYMREDLGLRNREIAALTNRSEKSTSGSYIHSITKSGAVPSASRPSASYSGIKIPISVIRDKTFGVLESIMFYLKEELSLKYAEIGRILHRDQRTVWTAVNRARKKRLAGCGA